MYRDEHNHDHEHERLYARNYRGASEKEAPWDPFIRREAETSNLKGLWSDITFPHYEWHLHRPYLEPHYYRYCPLCEVDEKFMWWCYLKHPTYIIPDRLKFLFSEEEELIAGGNCAVRLWAQLGPGIPSEGLTALGNDVLDRANKLSRDSRKYFKELINKGNSVDRALLGLKRLFDPFKQPVQAFYIDRHCWNILSSIENGLIKITLCLPQCHGSPPLEVPGLHSTPDRAREAIRVALRTLYCAESAAEQRPQYGLSTFYNPRGHFSA